MSEEVNQFYTLFLLDAKYSIFITFLSYWNKWSSLFPLSFYRAQSNECYYNFSSFLFRWEMSWGVSPSNSPPLLWAVGAGTRYILIP
jgi:hypothetical protein